jgi:predicted nucleic acid-binding protein
VIIVSDTSPLHYLAVLDQIHVLPILYGKVICPPEVIAECLHAHAPELVRTWATSLPDWLEIRSVISPQRSELSPLDPGEAAAIQLALDSHADLLLIDERKGRLIAEQLGLRVTGVLAVLADAAMAGLLDFDEVSSQLIDKTNFRVSSRVIAAIRFRLTGKKDKPWQ